MAERPNICLISVDQMSYFSARCMGNMLADTPNIDRICREGMRFTRAYSSNPVCAAARATWVTGLHSSEHGVMMNEGTMSGCVRTIGEALRERGYDAMHSGKWHVPGRDVRECFQTLYVGRRDIGACSADYYDASTTWAAMDFLADVHDKPFFLHVSYINPHDICEFQHRQALMKSPPPSAWHMDFSAIPLPPFPEGFGYEQDEPYLQIASRRKDALIHEDIRRATEGWMQEQWRYYLWYYHRLVERVDAEIGLLLNTLDALPLREDTLILFTADHGESCGRHAMFQKFTLYEESIRVPLIVASLSDAFGIQKGRTSDALVSGVDIPATVCALGGLAPVRHGRDLMPLARGEDVPAAESVYVENNYYGRAVVTGQMKYIMEYLPCEACFAVPSNRHNARTGREQLFDLPADPLEQKNLIREASRREDADHMRSLLAAHEDTLAQTTELGGSMRETARKFGEAMMRIAPMA